MLVYLAALHTNGYKNNQRYVNLNDHEKSQVNALPNILESYHYIHKEKYVNVIRELGDKVFLDSGAFSAHTLGVELDLPTYCNYIQQNSDIIRVDDGVLMASVLDGIGDAQLTYDNQKRMEGLGVKPLPCFHAGEDERYLEYYIKNYEYITLGGMVGGSVKQLKMWLDRMWDQYLTDGSGRPRLKVHGFGITSVPLMERYPWYSCDSSAWIQAASYGTIVTPEYGPIQVSEKSPSIHVAGQHLETYTQLEREVLEGLLLKQGYNYERLSKVYESRAAYNLWAYDEVGKRLTTRKSDSFQREQPELF